MHVFDIETDGLIPELTEIKCLNVVDMLTGAELRFTDYATYLHESTREDTGVPTKRDGTIEEGLRFLAGCPVIGGHNVIAFDIPAIQKIHPGWFPRGRVRDSKVESCVMYTNIKELDFAAVKTGRVSDVLVKKGLAGTHKLESWGLRLGRELKGDFNPADYGHTWQTYPFSKTCDDYCMQDCRVNADLFRHFDSKAYSPECIQLEADVQRIIARQETHGWLFDVEAAHRLTAELQIELAEHEQKCLAAFDPWWVGTPRTWKRTSNRFVAHDAGVLINRGTKKTPKWERGWIQGEEQGARWTAVSLQVFNPGSRHHIADRLITVRGWEPQEFTESGEPKVDETTLNALPYPEAKPLAQYLSVTKMLGQLAQGKEAWLKHVKPDGRIHGRVNTNGAVTGRMTHSTPNVANADKDKRMRSLWIVPTGKKQVGCDAEGLELRCLAHYMARYDGGAYAVAVVDGKKEDGTDAHSVNMVAIGLRIRDNAKTWIYAFLYGAGNFKLGTIVYDDFDDATKARFNEQYPTSNKKAREKALVGLGKRSRDRIAKGLPALAKLIENVKKTARKQGYLRGLDGRRLHVRSEHAALNTLLQSAGAVIMKKALVLADATLTNQFEGRFAFVGNIHDEVQLEVDEPIADAVGAICADSIRLAGVHFGFRCPLAGSYAVGSSWAETH